ncbi:MAG TPA: NADH-ubiquinone oxidoreductase-F iron-sulfur binding region domain-containing protein [Acidimicrobiia bacterium]|nr:NADH-ubiquinone oxidoreductase-F iron-sulfur binding region domain-containing protein [Acidimicrobiia bacterium]
MGYLLPEAPLDSLDDYRQIGGGEGLSRALEIGPEETIGAVESARLRGRGGAGFPTGIKWKGVANAEQSQRRFLVCNAAEGEPGTFKDRALLRTNPYQVLEGMAIAAFAVGADEAYIGIKEKYVGDTAALETAASEMADAGMLGEIPIRVVPGPDDYLLGEEKGLLEAIEGRPPFPRWYPPYVVGLHTGMSAGVGAGSSGWDEQVNPTVVNNVETLANVAPILARGADWYRSLGTQNSPGNMLFTISGDVRTEKVAELPLGTPLAVLVHGVGEGMEAGRRVKAVFPGVSNAPLPDRLLDTPMDFESLAAVGSGLGSGGMIVYDDTACIVGVAAVLSRFLAVESCGQCPPCKLGTDALADRFFAIDGGQGTEFTLEEISAWIGRVTDANRCGLGAGERALASGVMRFYAEEVVGHLRRRCWSDRQVNVPKMVDWLPQEAKFVYDEGYFAWRQA